jgi:uncharacterized protein
MRYKIEVKRISSQKGKGVFAMKSFKPGDLIEKAPVLKLTPTERKQVEKTEMLRYVYPWRSTRSAAVVWGYGSIYNHSYEPNADWKQNFRDNTMVYKAIKPIKKGEEILVNYNGEPDDKTPIDWFPDGLAPK